LVGGVGGGGGGGEKVTPGWLSPSVEELWVGS